jgi:hypothetical protein
MFRILEEDWEDTELLENLPDALKRLKQIRRAGRTRAIVRDADGDRARNSSKSLPTQREIPPYKIRADQEKNRLYISLGKITRRELIKKAVSETKRVCRTLKPGFTCLTDLRHYEPLDQNDEKYIQQAQEILLKAGIRKIVRVGGKRSILGLFQDDQVSILFSAYAAQTATSLQKAERILDDASGYRSTRKGRMVLD